MRSVGGEEPRDAGSATVEFALTVPAAVGLVALAVSAGAWVLHLEAAQRGAADAARIAIADTDSAAIAAGESASGGLTPVLIRRGGSVTACIAVRYPPWPESLRCATAAEQR